jgi:hypothetical protein
MHAQYVTMIEKFEKLGVKNVYRLNNPENYEAVISLPKMLKEAARARKIVKEAEKQVADHHRYSRCCVLVPIN